MFTGSGTVNRYMLDPDLIPSFSPDALKPLGQLKNHLKNDAVSEPIFQAAERY